MDTWLVGCTGESVIRAVDEWLAGCSDEFLFSTIYRRRNSDILLTGFLANPLCAKCPAFRDCIQKVCAAFGLPWYATVPRGSGSIQTNKQASKQASKQAKNKQKQNRKRCVRVMVEVPFFTVGMIGARRWHSPFWWSQRTMDKDYTILVYRCDVLWGC